MSRDDHTWTTNVASGANFFTAAATDTVSRPDATTNNGPSLIANRKSNCRHVKIASSTKEGQAFHETLPNASKHSLQASQVNMQSDHPEDYASKMKTYATCLNSERAGMNKKQKGH